MWNGLALILKNKALIIKIIPVNTPTMLVKSDDDINPVNKLAKSFKFVSPVNPYNKDDPKSNKADEKAPKIKYFNPASVENSEVRLKLTKI